MKFSELQILPALESALAKENIIKPTEIQIESIPVIIDNKDVYISSETGTGKTLAYLLPLISKLNMASKDLQVIILTPTHELASQIQDQLIRLNQNSGLGIRSQLLIGGASTKRQVEKLKKKPHIVVGSAGRVLELTKMKKLKVHNVKSLVIDEADNMLFGESLELVNAVINSMLRGRQLILVSATNQTETNKVAGELSPDMVNLHTDSNQVSGSIEHIYFEAHENEKSKLLGKILRACEPELAIVFTHRNETAKRIARDLKECGIKAGEIHGGCDKNSRVKAIRKFKQREISVLVASDMAARGLDIKGVSHIFNVDIPGKSKDYLHRAGRTGRGGSNGYCISLMSGEELKIARRYQRELSINITKASISKGVIIFD